MTQSSLTIASLPASTVRANMNTAYAALATLSAGATAPVSTFPNQLWYDTSVGRLKVRNNANDAWIDVADIATYTPPDAADPAVNTVASALDAIFDAGIATKSAPLMPGDDFNLSIPSGLYRVGSATVNGPAGHASGSTVLAMQWDADNWSKFLVDGGGSSASAAPKVWLLAKNFGTLKSWVNITPLGVGQTWQTVSRSGGTSYQNTTGRTIGVSMSMEVSGSTIRATQVSTDSSTWVTIAQHSGSARSGISFAVKNGDYYRIDSGSSVGNLVWAEQR